MYIYVTFTYLLAPSSYSTERQSIKVLWFGEMNDLVPNLTARRPLTSYAGRTLPQCHNINTCKQGHTIHPQIRHINQNQMETITDWRIFVFPHTTKNSEHGLYGSEETFTLPAISELWTRWQQVFSPRVKTPFSKLSYLTTMLYCCET